MKALWVIVGVFLLLLIAGISLPFLVDLNKYQDRYRPIIEETLNRKVALHDIRLTLWPTVGARVHGFTVEDDPSFRSGSFASLSSLDIGVKLWPLVRGKVEIEQITLRDPVIVIVKNKAGVLNLSTLGSRASAPSPEAPPADAAAGPLRVLALLAVDTVTIDGGRLTYQDFSGSIPTEYMVQDLNFLLTAVHLGDTPQIHAAATLHPYQLPVTINGRFGPLTESLDIKQFEFHVGLGKTPFLIQGGLVAGSLDATLSSQLIDTTDIPLALPFTKPVRIKELHATVHAEHPRAANVPVLEDVEVKDLGLAVAMGQSVVNIKGTASHGIAHVTAASASFNTSDAPIPLPLVKPVEFQNVHVSAQLRYPPLKTAAPLELADITDFGATAVMGQSKVDLQGTLMAGRAKMTLVSKGLTTADLPVTIPVSKPIEISGLHAAVDATGREARLQTLTFEAFGGSVRGEADVGLVPSEAHPFHVALTMEGLQLNPLAQSFGAQQFSLSGTGAAKLSLLGRGSTKADLLKTLEGAGKVMMKEAKIDGLNVMKEVSALLQLAGVPVDSAKATVFSAVDGDVTVKQGIITLQRLFLDCHDFQATGQGTTGFDQSLNVRVRLALSQAASRRIAASSPLVKTALSGGRLSLPVIVTGTWHAPSYRLDTGVLTVQMQERGRQKLNEAVHGLLEGTTKPEDLRQQGKDLLKDFLGR